MKYIAHISEDREREQSVVEHLKNTACFSKEFADEFDAADWGEVIGILHDTGKFSKEFYERIMHNAPRCDHSTAGAKVVLEDEKILFGSLLAYCIAGHHSGLQDWGSGVDNELDGTLKGRLSKSYEVPDYSDYKKEIDFQPLLRKIEGKFPNIHWTFEEEHRGFILAFYTRMLYSCLVDADYLDTEEFVKNGDVQRGVRFSFLELRQKLTQHMENLQKTSKPSKINSYRQTILHNCLSTSCKERGLFTLTVPTGGGKTLSSMTFAINHCIENHMKRIIYVIPYTSIIEQNAQVFSRVLGENVILEHHSNYDWDDNEHKQEDYKRLASENWDMPIVVTTNVQFFESLFANKSSRCRKLHNIANSIIIFDEAQMIPLNYLQPCISAIQELVSNYKCTAVLCSATQPAIQNMLSPKLVPTEICSNWRELYDIFKRTEIQSIGVQSNDDLISQIENLDQCLIIVNTRKHARDMTNEISGDGVFHLSTLMCNQHRTKMITEIKRRLSENERCIVISTRLIEAGVDVDFPVVFRAIAGLDSIIQSAGRCNREGRLKNEKGELILGQVYVFEPEEKYYKNQPKSFQLPIEITKSVMKQYSDISSPEAIKMFFKEMYFYSGELGLDIKKIMKRLDEGLDFTAKQGEYFQFEFNKISNDFRLIESNTYAVIVPYDEEAECIIKQLQFTGPNTGLMRKLQKYTVNVYENELNVLKEAGVLKIIAERTYILLEKTSGYDDITGLKVVIETGVGYFV